MPHSPYLTAAQVAERLGVRRETVYAYVSRGLLRSQPGPGPRQRLYPREDVERLEARVELHRTPERAAQRTLSWGTPVLDSEITLIADGSFHYRGHDAVALARERRFEEVCGLLWQGSLEAPAGLDGRIEPLPREVRTTLRRLGARHPAEWFQLAIRLLAASDAGAGDLRPHAVCARAARIVGALAMTLGAPAQPVAGGVARALRRGIARGRPEAEPILERALILCADHELNVSSFTARCVASAGSSPWDVVAAGLSALRGFRHGGASDRVGLLFAEAGVPALDEASAPSPSRAAVRRALDEWLARGERIPGFGHPLYPGGDPRWGSLLQAMEEVWGSRRELDGVRRIAEAGAEMAGDLPNVDLALGSIARLLAVRSGGWAIFALGRSAGWIAHALEQYAQASLIRPRARYVGLAPRGELAT
jgi:citrate synthase